MKATLCIEYIGEANDAGLALWSRVIDQTIGGGKSIVGKTAIRRPWVAEILGVAKRFGLARHFLRANWQRKRASGAHNRGVELWFILEANRFYEVNTWLSWRRSDRYFCTVSEGGEIIRVSATEVEAWVKKDSA